VLNSLKAFLRYDIYENGTEGRTDNPKTSLFDCCRRRGIKIRKRGDNEVKKKTERYLENKRRGDKTKQDMKRVNLNTRKGSGEQGADEKGGTIDKRRVKRNQRNP